MSKAIIHRPVRDAKVGRGPEQEAITAIPPPAVLPGLSRRTFVQWGLGGVATLALAQAGCQTETETEIVGAASSALDPPAEDHPIFKKWVKLGGEAVVGAPTSEITDLPAGNGQFQTFAGGVIVYSVDHGAILVSSAIFAEWLFLESQLTPEGQNLMTFVGFPREDYVAEAGLETAHFERGMIIVSAGVLHLVSGFIYEHYFDVTPSLGLPLSPQLPTPGGGLIQAFQDGDIHWHATLGAAAVRGATRARWWTLGGPAGPLGRPLSDEEDVQRDGVVIGKLSRFEDGAVYFSAATGAWEVMDAIRRDYEGVHGGPGALNGFGLPTSGQSQTPTSGGLFNNFQKGVIVSHGSGPFTGVVAFRKLELFIERLQGDGDDLVWGVGGPQDLFVNIDVTTSQGTVINVRRPESGTYEGGQDINEAFDLTPGLQSVHSDLVVDVAMDARDVDFGKDDHLGTVHVVYSIDNLWGFFDGGPHTVSDNGSFTATFSIKNPLPFDPDQFRQQLWWSFSNFGTSQLTYDQFAATFIDVDTTEVAWLNPFNELYYNLAYKKVAKSGNCFGMSLESVYAQVGRSLYSEPILRFWPDTQDGVKLDPAIPNHQATINEINIKQSYQIGAACIDWFLASLITGRTHDPMQVFLTSRDAFEAGDFPVLCLMDSYFGGNAHSVRPYKWDQSDPGNWVIFVANPNNPVALNGDDDDPCIVTIDTASNTFTFKFSSLSTYSGGTWSGGRMLTIPFRRLDHQPRTPFWEVFGFLFSGLLLLVGDSGQSRQITDGGGRTLFEPGLGSPPTRWDQYRQDTATRIPNLTRVALSGGAPGPVPLEMFYGRSAGATYHHEVAPAAGVAAGTPYEWVLHSATLSAKVVIPGTPGVADVLTASALYAPSKSVTVEIPVAGGNKTITWTMAGPVKQRWFELTNLQMAAGQAITTRISNSGYAFTFENDGPATTADLRVKAGPGATPVVVGTIVIGPGTSEAFQFSSPKTTLTFTGTPGNADWYLTPIVITLTAQDYSSTGIAVIEYSKDGVIWTVYSGPFLYADEGVTTLFYRATSNAGDQETTRSRELEIDTRKPMITVSFDPTYTRLIPVPIHYSAIDPIPGSGLAEIGGKLNGQAVNDGQVMDMFWQSLGTYTLVVTASDVAGWVSTNSASFELIATLASLKGTITKLRQLGQIDGDGTANSFSAKVDAATSALDHGNLNAAHNQLDALLNALSAQSGNHITAPAAKLLIADVIYVQAHLA